MIHTIKTAVSEGILSPIWDSGFDDGDGGKAKHIKREGGQTDIQTDIQTDKHRQTCHQRKHWLAAGHGARRGVTRAIKTAMSEGNIAKMRPDVEVSKKWPYLGVCASSWRQAWSLGDDTRVVVTGKSRHESTDFAPWTELSYDRSSCVCSLVLWWVLAQRLGEKRT